MSTIQVKLLNDGGYDDAENVKFPVVVKGFRSCVGSELLEVSADELIKVGFGKSFQDLQYWNFLEGSECEVIS